jgi:CDP-glycerol glycerophosphotransferase (TagB/SpsB family)
MPKKKNIWLIGGHNGQLYTDNAKVFHQYILAHHPHIDIYWVIAKNAPAFQKINAKKLHKGSIKSYLYFYHAEVTLFSDTLNSDIAPLSFVLPLIKRFYRRTFKVYLSHGTIVFKKMPTYTGKVGQIKKDIFHSYNLAIASSELSKKAMIGYNIQKDNIVIAGSARHDTLLQRKATQRSILVSPTWRNWLSTPSSLKDSDFFHHYHRLLVDARLNDYLETHNIILHFYLHHMFHHHLHAFESLGNDRIHILPPQSNIAEIIATSELMVTDYSSICSDFYYLQKPVLFFQFDRDKFITEIGSEIDLKHDTFGDVSFECERLIDKIIASLETGNKLSNLQKEGEKYFIHFTDKENCKRIYHSIIKRTKARA